MAVHHGHDATQDPSKNRLVPASTIRTSAFLFVTLILVFALVALGFEGLLRLLDRAKPIVSGWRAPQLPSTRLQHNQLGFRGFPIEYTEHDFVIVLVGDSQVQADACSYYWLPERRLEHHLSYIRPVRVFSLGAYGWGQDQQLLALREYYQRFRADLVIVWLTPGNDLWNNTFPTVDDQGRQPKPTFWLEGGELRGPTSQIGDVVSHPLRLLTAYQRVWASWDREWERRLPPPYVPLRDYDGPVKQTWQSLWDRGLGNVASDDMASEKSHQTIWLTPRSPRTQYSVDLTHRLLQEMAAEARAHGSSFATFSVNRHDTVNPDDEVDLGKGEEAVFVLNGNYYRVSDRQREATIGDVTRGFTSYVVPPPSGEWRVSPTDGHFNEHAVDETMHHLAKAVQVHVRSS